MRHAIALLSMVALSSCIDTGVIKEYDPVTGRMTMSYSAGRNFMGKREDFIVHIKGKDGREIFAAGKKEETEEVPKTVTAAAGLAVGQGITAKTTQHADTLSAGVATTKDNNATGIVHHQLENAAIPLKGEAAVNQINAAKP